MEESKTFNRKLLIIVIGFLFFFLIIVIRLFYLQILCDEECIKKITAEKIPYEVHKIVSVPTYRGSIKDSEGNILVISVPSISVYARPKACRKVEDRNIDTFIKRFSSLTGISPKLLRKYIKSDKTHVWIARGLYKNVENIKRELDVLLKKTGMSICIGYIDDFKRRYLYGRLASNLIGHVDTDGRGIEGIEKMYDDYLGGGIKQVYISYSKSLGRFVTEPIFDSGSFLTTRDVILTINLSAQKVAEEIKREIVSKWNPKKVIIVAMDIKSGDIVAMANYPDYNPNFYRRYRAYRKRNFAVTDLFEPGSTMKPFFISYALWKGYVKENMKIDTGKGITEVYGRKVRDPKRLGMISLKEVIIHSSNVGAIEVAKRLSKRDAEKIMEIFHLDKSFNSLIGEVKPKLPDFSYPANILYASIGQGLSFNTLNLVTAFGSLATGKIVKPRIVKKIVDSTGKTIREEDVKILEEEILDEKTRKWIMDALIKVVEEGTGKRAQSPYFYIAGKTGTAQKFDFHLNRYSKERVTTYFVGIFPAKKPRFVAAIVVDEPKGNNLYGGTVCAPYFKKLVESIAFFYQLEPDKNPQIKREAISP